jgi:U5 small nuclear ribonucleoprotein component
VSVLVQEEDAQPLTEPIVAPIKERKYHVTSKEEGGEETRFDKSCVDCSLYLCGLRSMDR